LAFGPWHPGSSLERAHYFRVEPDEEQAVHFIQEHVGPDQAIFVGNPQHHQVFANDVLFYFLAQRQSGTWFYVFDPAVINKLQIQEEVTEELVKNRVKYVVLCSGFEKNGTERPPDSGVTLLDDFIRANYRETLAVGRFTIWESWPKA